MKDPSSLHLKVQELCDCFATADPLKEMSAIAASEEDEDALKWIALAVLHGINNNAKRITLSTDEEGNVEITAKYRKATLPSPGPEIGKKVVEIIRAITHMERERDRMTLALGFRNNDFELPIQADKKKGRDCIDILFP